MKLCVFPNDPIGDYYDKGYLKERYFNPGNFFTKVHIISPTDNDISEDLIKNIVGSADLKIHSVGKNTVFNIKKKKDDILQLVDSINSDVIRAYNPLAQGWLAAYCSDKLKIPFYLSLHSQYDGYRKLMKKKKFKRYLALKYSRKFIEPFVLSKANKITGVYKIIDKYVEDLSGKHPEIIYNKINLDQFKNGKKILNFNKPLILSVGRLSPEKNHRVLIQAIKNLDLFLIIIGNGELEPYLKELVKKLNIEYKVIFKKSIPNSEIQNYYKSADLFVLPYDPEIEGIPIAVLESIASGLPAIVPFPVKGYSDGLEKSAEFSRMDVNSLTEKIEKLITDKEYLKKLSVNALKKSEEFDENISEMKEVENYRKLLNMKN